MNACRLFARLGFALMLGLVMVLAACDATGSEAQAEFTDVTTLVGQIDDELFVAFDVFEPTDPGAARGVAAYLCDGAGTSTWIGSRFEGEDVTLVGDDTEVIVSFATPSPNDVRPASASGTVSIGGGPAQSFEVAEVPSDGEANLYRAEGSVDETGYVGGWIVLEDGQQRGALKADGDIVENPVLQLPSGEFEASVEIGPACICIPPVHDNPCCVSGL